MKSPIRLLISFHIKKANRWVKLAIFFAFIVACSQFIASCQHLSDRSSSGISVAKNNSLKKASGDDPYCKGDALEVTFCQRRRHLQNVCQEYYNPLIPFNKIFKNYEKAAKLLTEKQSRESAFFVDDANRILTCAVPQVGSTIWKKLLLYLSENANFSSPNEIAAEFVQNKSIWPGQMSFRPLSFYKNETEKLERLMNYTKIIWVRHPLRRLVSVWSSNLQNPNPYYSKILWDYVIDNLRLKKRGQKGVAGKTSLPITLKEFFEYLSREGSSFSMVDVHWSLVSVLCLPCFVQFDYIAKLENWEIEAEYVLRKVLNGTSTMSRLQSPDVKDVLSHKKTSPLDDVWKEKLDLLPKGLVRRITSMFSMDFELFGYI